MSNFVDELEKMANKIRDYSLESKQLDPSILSSPTKKDWDEMTKRILKEGEDYRNKMSKDILPETQALLIKIETYYKSNERIFKNIQSTLTKAQDFSILIVNPLMGKELASLLTRLGAQIKILTVKDVDVFICHDSNDKKDFVEPLYTKLTSNGVSVWYDNYSLKIGDSLIDKIEEGIKTCNFGIIIVSKQFMKNFKWPRIEFKALRMREIELERNIILPIWRVGVTQKNVSDYSLLLADRYAGKESEGLENIVAMLLGVLKS